MTVYRLLLKGDDGSAPAPTSAPGNTTAALHNKNLYVANDIPRHFQATTEASRRKQIYGKRYRLLLNGDSGSLLSASFSLSLSAAFSSLVSLCSLSLLFNSSDNRVHNALQKKVTIGICQTQAKATQTNSNECSKTAITAK